jgi:hypothetical protein
MTNHLFKKIRDAIEGRESRLFLETPAGIALTYAGMIPLSGRYAFEWIFRHERCGENNRLYHIIN